MFSAIDMANHLSLRSLRFWFIGFFVVLQMKNRRRVASNFPSVILSYDFNTSLEWLIKKRKSPVRVSYSGLCVCEPDSCVAIFRQNQSCPTRKSVIAQADVAVKTRISSVKMKILRQMFSASESAPPVRKRRRSHAGTLKSSHQDQRHFRRRHTRKVCYLSAWPQSSRLVQRTVLWRWVLFGTLHREVRRRWCLCFKLHVFTS